jgi:radical SAM/Cys-rich protein
MDVYGARMNSFENQVQKDCGLDLNASNIEILQVNVGLKCNLSCRHCHLACGPERTEMMSWETMGHVIIVAKDIQPEFVDITGGAPELHPHLRAFIEALRMDGHTVQVRTNLTLLTEPGFEDLPEFFEDHRVQLVASLPCYMGDKVAIQRGKGVFEKSIRMLRELNVLGYGIKPDLPLHLIYNPVGPILPPDQGELEEDFKRELDARFGIHFTSLYTIANMPIGRFWERLKKENKGEEYMALLRRGFNCQTVTHLMCRHQICVAWDGVMYDCDFNIALGLPVVKEVPEDIEDFNADIHRNRRVRTGEHCFGCTAGSGSSCGGSLASSTS